MPKQKLDKKFYGTIYKVKDDTALTPDEYVVFLAKDNAFAAILPMYKAKCIEMGCDKEQIAAVDQLIHNVNEWRNHHIDKLKNPDAHGEKLLD